MGISREESERDPNWSGWYGTIVPDFSGLKTGESFWGDPEPETLALFAQLPKGSTILDIGGGDGGYALPLAAMGHDVIVVDVHEPSLRRLKVNSAVLPQDSGTIFPVKADITVGSAAIPDSVDAVLSTGFAYLMPPDVLKAVFANMTASVKSRGLVALEFATDIIRRPTEHSKDLLFGKDEQRYTFEEGKKVLGEIYKANGIERLQIKEKLASIDIPYYYRSKLLIASGIKQ